MAIPNGYRLLTKDDIGKVFGVDLETTVYINREVSLSSAESYFIQGQTTNLTNFIYASKLYSDGYEAYVPRIDADLNYELIWEGTAGWTVSDVDTVSATEGLEITSFNTNYEWNTWFYVKDIIEKVIVTKSKITNLADKVRAKAGTSINYTIDAMADAVENLQLGVDEETIYTNLNEMTFGAGYTLTLNVGTDILNDSNYTYSLDDGSTWLQFTNTVMTLTDVSTIKFQGGYGLYSMAVGTTSNAYDVCLDYSDNLILTEATTWYVTKIYNAGGIA